MNSVVARAARFLPGRPRSVDHGAVLAALPVAVSFCSIRTTASATSISPRSSSSACPPPRWHSFA